MQEVLRTDDARPARTLAEQVGRWIQERDAADLVVSEWQSLEHKVFLDARSKGADLEQMLGSDLPASRRLRTLAKQIAAADRRLGKTAVVIANRSSRSTNDALAKIKLGLRMAQFCCGDESQWALVKTGFDDLQALID